MRALLALHRRHAAQTPRPRRPLPDPFRAGAAAGHRRARTAWDATAGAKRPTADAAQPARDDRTGSATRIVSTSTRRNACAPPSPGATVNDVLLAVVGGGLRRYLGATGELPGGPMVAGVPMSMRTEADAGDGRATRSR